MDNFDWRKTININILVLRFVGLWPQGYEIYKRDLYLLYSVLATTVIIGGHNLSQIIQIFYVYSDLEALSATIFVAATNIFAVIKRFLFVKKLGTIKKLFRTLNTDQFRPKTSQHMALVQVSVAQWKQAYVYFSVLVYLNVTLWSLIPVMNNWIKNRQLPFAAWYPFDAAATSRNYGITYAYQLICIWYITVTNLNLDTLIYAFMMFIGVQCDMLTANLKNLQEDKVFGKELKICIKHHMEILSLAKNSNDFFNYIILGQIATSTAALALAMFQLSLTDPSSGAGLTHLAYVFGMCSEIFFYCWFGNEVEIKSSQIPYAAFQSKWIGQCGGDLRNLLILCMRCKKPISIRAINLFTLSLETFIGILRSAWSYFALLTNVNDKGA